MDEKIKKESENEFTSIEEENKIIEEIIKNRLLIKETHFDKDYSDLEEDENEDDISEKDKITEEILDNKLSFIVPDENENEKSQEEIKTQRKIHKDIIEDLLIVLFNYHYDSITGKKRKSPQARMFATKYHIEFFYTKLNINFINFSKYILLILEQKIEELIEYIKNNIYKKKMSVQDVLDIKKSLYLVGINITKIFERPFEKTRNFDISSVLEVLFISDILNNNDIDINDQEYEEIVNISKLDEKDNFEKYIEECKTYFEKIENGEREEEDVEVEEEKIYEEKNEENIIIEDNEKNKRIQRENEEINNNEKINKENKKESEEKNSNDKNIIEKNEALTVDDLLKYINGSDDKKKKKRKRRKKKKVEDNTNMNYNKIKEEKDDVIESFKSYIINFSENLEKNQKIKPNISQSFLDKL